MNRKITLTPAPRIRDAHLSGPGWHWEVVYENQVVRGEGECNSENDAAAMACAAYKRLADIDHDKRQERNASRAA